MTSPSGRTLSSFRCVSLDVELLLAPCLHAAAASPAQVFDVSLHRALPAGSGTSVTYAVFV